MSPDEHGSHRRPARPLDMRERTTLDRLERDLDASIARAERVAMRRLERDLERDDPAFATLLRANADSPATQSAASATVRAWIWILSVTLTITVGMGGVVLVAATLGGVGLVVGAALLLAGFVTLVAVDRLC